MEASGQLHKRRYPLDRRLGGRQGQSSSGGEKKKIPSLQLPGMEPQPSSLVTVVTKIILASVNHIKFVTLENSFETQNTQKLRVPCYTTLELLLVFTTFIPFTCEI